MKLDEKNIDIDFKKDRRHRNKDTLRCEGTIVRLYNSVMQDFSRDDPSKNWKPLAETNEGDLDTNLCKFFKYLVRPDGAFNYNSSTLKSYFSAMKRHLFETRNIQLIKGEWYKEIMETVSSRMDENEEEGSSSTPFREEDIRQCFMAGTMGLDNPKSLLTIVIYNLTVDFGCNSALEVHDLLNSDIIFGPLNESREPEYIQLSDRVLKWRKESNGLGRVVLNSAVLYGSCPVKNILFFQNMKTPIQLEPDQPFLLNPVRNDQHLSKGKPWFDNLRLGRNSIVKVFKTAMLEAGVDLSGQKITFSSAKKSRRQVCKNH